MGWRIRAAAESYRSLSEEETTLRAPLPIGWPMLRLTQSRGAHKACGLRFDALRIAPSTQYREALRMHITASSNAVTETTKRRRK